MAKPNEHRSDFASDLFRISSQNEVVGSSNSMPKDVSNPPSKSDHVHASNKLTKALEKVMEKFALGLAKVKTRDSILSAKLERSTIHELWVKLETHISDLSHKQRKWFYGIRVGNSRHTKYGSGFQHLELTTGGGGEPS
jgi:hypothetical protein